MKSLPEIYNFEIIVNTGTSDKYIEEIIMSRCIEEEVSQQWTPEWEWAIAGIRPSPEGKLIIDVKVFGEFYETI